MRPKEFDLLVDAFKSLPSIGTKNAEKMSYFLLSKDNEYVNEFIKRINDATNKIKYCKQCNNFSINGDICDICSNENRINEKLCIVSYIEDLYKIEKTNSYQGKYFILGKEIDVKKQTHLPKETIQKLMSLIKNNSTKEVIIATNLTIDGEATSQFIKKVINNIDNSIKVYRIGFGLPINSSLDYADELSLKYALKNKVLI